MQLATKARKRFTWPVYVAGLRARLECDACVLVVTPFAGVAGWTERAKFYADVVGAALGDAARLALEALMQTPERREYLSEFARKYAAVGEARAILTVLAVLEQWIRQAVTAA